MRSLPPALVLLLLLVPGSAAGQGLRGVGIFGGSSESHQIRSYHDDSGAWSGFVGGAWLDVQLPASGWSILAEGGYATRGGTYPVASGFTGKVESDVLEATLAPSRHFDVGFAGAYAYAGPTLEMPVRTRASVDLKPAFSNPASQVFSVTGGAGIELRLPETYAFRLELRHVEGLSADYTGDQGDFKHRATEILVRVGKSRR